MAEKIRLTIILSKEVDTEEQAATLYNAVKVKMADNPSVSVSGHTNKKLTD